MTPLEHVLRSICSSEELLMQSYGAAEQLVKQHLRIARLAVLNEINKKAQDSPRASTTTVL